eukprot:1145536-Pelagomonas_calceolata.AAC.8
MLGNAIIQLRRNKSVEKRGFAHETASMEQSCSKSLRSLREQPGWRPRRGLTHNTPGVPASPHHGLRIPCLKCLSSEIKDLEPRSKAVRLHEQNAESNTRLPKILIGLIPDPGTSKIAGSLFAGGEETDKQTPMLHCDKAIDY